MAIAPSCQSIARYIFDILSLMNRELVNELPFCVIVMGEDGSLYQDKEEVYAAGMAEGKRYCD